MPARFFAVTSLLQALFLAVAVFTPAAQAGQPGPNAGAAPGGAVVKASAFGFNPADATRALQAAIDSGAAKVIVDNPGRPWIVGPIALASNQEISFEKGTEVLAKAGAFLRTGDSLFRAHLKQNITLTGYGATLRMRRSDYAAPPYRKGEWRHVLDLRSCTHVRICGLTLAESGGDGIYLGTATGSLPNKDIQIKDVVCDKNYRQGISVINAEDLLIENCVLRDTAGTAPAAGIDFEPNAPGERLVNCTLRNCLSQNNAGGGYFVAIPGLTAASRPVSLRFEHCRSIADRQAAILVHTGNRPEKAVRGTIEFTDCEVRDCTTSGIIVSDKPAAGCRLRLVNCALRDVAAAQPRRTPILLATGQLSTQPLGGIEMIDLVIRDRGQRKVMALADSAGGLGLKDVTGNLILEEGPRRTSLKITEKLLTEWMPQIAIKAIPRVALAGKSLTPVSAGSAPKPEAAAFVRLRQTARLVLYATRGQEVVLRIRHLHFAKYSGRAIPLTVAGPSGGTIHRATLPFDEETEVRFQAPESGLYRLAADPGLNFLQIAASSHPLCFNAEDGPIHFLATRGEFFFWVPEGTKQFGVRVCGEGVAEGVKATLVNPQGHVVEEQDDVAPMRQFEVTLPSTSPGAIWSLRLARPKHLVMEDHFVDLRGIPPLLAVSREALLKP
jgi:hypothetical protein